MNAELYDNVPFTRDYYDKLTSEETKKVLEMYKGIRKVDLEFTAETITNLLIHCVMSVTVITTLLRAFDIEAVFKLAAGGSYFGNMVVLPILCYGTYFVFWVKLLIYAIKDYKKDDLFFIAKGTIISIKKENVRPGLKINENDEIDYDSVSDSDGLKLTMELAVSGHEKISGINISNYSDVIDKIHIGSTAVVMHYPKTGMNITFIEEIGNEF